MDGNEAVARVAHRLSEVCAIYPITPASGMGEYADAWSAAGQRNLWGALPQVVQMQSEAGAAGALHGAVQKGALGTTFTASQGLLLMLPNMFKMAGELTPAVIHVAARTVATHALSIFGDHSDVMAARSTGWAMLSSTSVQEAQDFALVSHAATLRTRVPFVNFFDGFRTSHEVAKIALLSDSDLAAIVRWEDVVAHRARGLSPEHPELHGTAQNPDVFFQSREAANPYYDRVPGQVRAIFGELAARTGRAYHLVDYYGDPAADRVIVLMGSAFGAAREVVDVLRSQGERVGVLVVRLYRPFPSTDLVASLPGTACRIAVLDRVKEPGAPAEPLHLDASLAVMEQWASIHPGMPLPLITGGRYGLASKEFRPQDAAAIFADLAAQAPKPRFTAGIHDDVTHLSLRPVPVEVPRTSTEAVFYGLGSDGTVGANKASITIIGEHTDLHAQGYFVYDSKKSGSITVSHLRFGPEPIQSTYLIEAADFVAVHQWSLLERVPIADIARPGATLLLNSRYPADEVWDLLPGDLQRAILAKGLQVWTIDAARIARDAGLGGRINTVMQPCFFHLAGVIDSARAIDLIKEDVAHAYGRRGHAVVERNHAAIDKALDHLYPVTVPAHVRPARQPEESPGWADAPAFVQHVTARMLAGEGDLLPVSAFPADGSFPTGTSRWEKRALAAELPVWDPDLCIDCGKCAIACPHAAIRMKAYPAGDLAGAPDGFQSKAYGGKDLPGGTRLTVQVAPDDCTGCGICVDICPARSTSEPAHKSLDLADATTHRERERASFDFFLRIPEVDRSLVRHDTVKGSQLLQPLFEFSGACSGCGETPYLKLLTQQFGDRMVVANATGCSSIYGGNLPTTPWAANADGRGPAWSNSLFEDNAEFGLGIRLGMELQHAHARDVLEGMRPQVGEALADALLAEEPRIDDERGMAERRAQVALLESRLATMDDERARELLSLAEALIPACVWIVGGDGWAYDIGFGGLDHVLSSGRNVNVLVLDTEVYSNTGGQASKSTARGATAKFASVGKSTRKKDLGLLAQAYGDVYVAQIAMGANETQTVRAMLEAAAYDGPSVVIAYSPCIAHGIDLGQSIAHQKAAVASGYWPLYRFHPSPETGAHPFSLDSKAPTIPLHAFEHSETRFSALERSDPERAAQLEEQAQADVDERWHYYTQLASVERTMTDEHEGSG